MIRKLVLTGVVTFIFVGLASPAYAQNGSDDAVQNTAKNLVNTVNKTTDDTVAKTDDTVKSTTESTTHELRDTIQSERQQIESHKSELKDQIQNKLENRQQKLEGRRLAQCENRQKSINELMDKSVVIGKNRLAHIQQVEQRVKDFYTKKSLSSEQYDAAVQAANQAEISASAAIDVMDSTVFDCTKIDGAAPSDSIRTIRSAKHQALDNYRAAVVNLIKVVKDAYSAQQSEAATGVQR
jgi:hypothetical protein